MTKSTIITIGGNKENMIAVIFEVYPKNGKVEEYLSIAQELKPELSKISGFISIERFQSLVNPDKILSLSFWENEALNHCCPK
jgi:heme-degrading monooxygenase HmoA